jgi:spore germination cell wall hydrolase CwlJ-like protein
LNSIIRACGAAAAALALVAGASLAAPSTALEAKEASAMLDPQALTAMAGEIAEAAYAAVPRPRSLGELVEVYAADDVAEEQQACLAKGVYFEARGESLEGQLAVADVILNRAASGKYPSSICGVITQKAQFSFIKDGQFPEPKKQTKAWRKAVAVARIARERLDAAVPSDVLWYHADYVQPIWRHGLAKVDQVGVHIFYRASARG